VQVVLLVLAIVVVSPLLLLGQMFWPFPCLFRILQPGHPPGYRAHLRGPGSCFWVIVVAWVGAVLLVGSLVAMLTEMLACFKTHCPW